MAQVRPANAWTAVPNTWLRDKEISLKTKGLLCMMNSLPSDWTFTVEGLATISKEGVDAVRTSLKEAEQSGYLTREYIRDEQGHIIDTKYLLHEQPKKTGKTPNSEKPMSGSKRQYNKEENNKEKEKNYSAENTDSGVDVVVVERMGYNTKGEWKKNKTFYTTVEEADKIEAAGESDYPEFDYWASRGMVGGDRGKKTMRGYKKTCFKLSYSEPDGEKGGPKVKYQTDYCY